MTALTRFLIAFIGSLFRPITPSHAGSVTGTRTIAL
jgi:hypothetical protein